MIVKWLGQHNYALSCEMLNSLGISHTQLTQGEIDTGQVREIEYEKGIRVKVPVTVPGVLIEFEVEPNEDTLITIDSLLPYCKRNGSYTVPEAIKIKNIQDEINSLKADITSMRNGMTKSQVRIKKN